jgi:phospholipid-binding lipoprotein MlaA
MKNNICFKLIAVYFSLLWLAAATAAYSSDEKKLPLQDAKASSAVPGNDYDDEYGDQEKKAVDIPDPLEPLNRVFFQFNDKFYFYVLNPVTKAYKAVAPEKVRKCIKNFFSNTYTGISFVSCILQGKFEGAATDFRRFTVNTTVGLLGFFDPAKNRYGLVSPNEDIGQALAFYGVGHVFYLDLPVLGPSSLRDGIGFAGETYCAPYIYYLKFNEALGCYSLWVINNTSFSLGNYESIKEAAFDPYIALRNGYVQYRESQIRK